MAAGGVKDEAQNLAWEPPYATSEAKNKKKKKERKKKKIGKNKRL